MNDQEIEFLEGGNYLSFSTRKKSGEFVSTPVWFAPGDGSYYLFSANDAGKVKRLRNFSESRVASCTVTGVVTGDWLDTEAHILESDADQASALSALHRKYGWQMKITDLMSKLSGKFNRRTYIRVDLKGK